MPWPLVKPKTNVAWRQRDRIAAAPREYKTWQSGPFPIFQDLPFSLAPSAWVRTKPRRGSGIESCVSLNTSPNRTAFTTFQVIENRDSADELCTVAVLERSRMLLQKRSSAQLLSYIRFMSEMDVMLANWRFGRS